MDKEQLIDNLWEKSNHGTRREDVVSAYEAGVAAERERWIASNVIEFIHASADGTMPHAERERKAGKILDIIES